MGILVLTAAALGAMGLGITIPGVAIAATLLAALLGLTQRKIPGQEPKIDSPRRRMAERSGCRI